MSGAATRPLLSVHQDTVQAADPGRAPGLDENALLHSWQPDIRRAAARAATRKGTAPESAQDFAQDASLRLLLVARRTGDTSVPYLRRVIQNEIRDSVRRERRAITTVSERGGELPEEVEAPDITPQVERRRAVGAWVASLPSRLGRLYEMLYDHGMTQREAAVRLGLSQPRVAQLHRELLTRGRLELADLVA